MKRPGMILLLALFLASTLAVVSDTGAQDDNLPSREKAAKLFSGGNWKEAYDLYSKLALDPKDEPNLVGNDLNNAVNCLQRLGRRSEIDAFLEKVIKAHSGNWRLLWAAAQRYLNIQHNGFIVAGEFNRGSKRGGGKYVDSYERDRTRALQLMVLAMGKNKGETDRTAVGRFYRSFSNMLITSRYGQDAWRLQYLSNLSELPDYDEGRRYWYGYRQRGAPVNPDGTPVYHHLPKSWKESKTDGERWRWCLMQAAEYNPSLKAQLRYQFAGFLHNQFGVRTMAGYGWRFGRGADDDKKDESGPYALTTLREDETISRLATGIKRFKLLDEFNFIKIYQQIAKENKGYGENALNALAGIFEDRQQYPKAADYWRRNIREFREKSWKRRRLNQITGNWGMFEPVMTQPAGSGASVEFRFRNGQKVSFKAHEINITKLLRDVKEYLKTRPKKLDWQKVNIGNLGYRLVTKNQRKYIVKRVAAWDLDLKPRPAHFDKRITVATPLQKAGAYLLTAKMKGGNTTHIIIWVADTVIVKKQLDKQLLFYVADAESGKPVAKANLEFFGYWQKWVRDDKRGQGHYELHLKNLAEFTDADGQVILAEKRLPRNYQYIITATTPKGRLAYLGWTGVWYGTRYDREYKATKAFVITDRPVYRPKHTVKFKFWVNHAKYDQEGKSAFAGRNFTVRIRNPKNEKVFEKSFKADDYGGVSGEFTLPKGAALGMYRIHIPGKGGGSFRVEEYKKPEFEVTIEAPKEPVMLGEKITATISAKYLFGAPVKEAKVKYKVLRTSHDARWYPWGIWDWYYSPGYWWYAYDYTWYPGWWEWGCRRPWPWWRWGGRWGPREQPEVVSENEVEIGPDGMLKIEIDTAVAKAIHPDIDHKYEITAEVTDKSRRTIVGTGTVLVARRPFKVYAWVDRGHYRVGDTVRASFRAQTLDNKPVKGKGVLKLLRIKYNKDKRPVETLVRKWSLDTNVEGVARQQIKASRAGQYRLSYTLTDSKKHKIEGGYVFIIAGRGFDSSEFRFNDIELVTDKREYKPGEKVSLRVNTNRTGGTVLLFLRPANGICLPPKVLRLKGKSAVEEIEVAKKDMPNFFVEALTVHGGKVHTEVREVIVPPESRILKVEVTPSAKRYKPGEKAKIKVKLIDASGEPFVGSTVIAMYDKAVEYISGGSNVPDIKEFFWKWRRRHQPRTEHSLNRGGNNTVASGKDRMTFLGAFGHMSVNLPTADGDVEAQIGLGMKAKQMRLPGSGMGYAEGRESLMEQSAGMPRASRAGLFLTDASGSMAKGASSGPGPKVVQPVVRKKFADTALWVAALETDKNGEAEVELTMPENLTTWKTKVWALGNGTRVGQAETEVITTKDLIIRLQAPRFFVQKDEVVLSAIVHNYLKTKKNVQVVLEMKGGCMEPLGVAITGEWNLQHVLLPPKTIEIAAGGEARVDWRVKVVQPGEATITMKALTDEESDAMQMTFPVYIHGMLKTESFSGVIRPEKQRASVDIRVPKERLPEQSRLEIRYSPTLAGAMVDALPYLVSYPYGCTEQTLNRFLPTVITQKVLLRMGLDLKAIRDKRTNLNAQEIGDDRERAKQWKRFDHNPVFDEELVADMVKAGVEKLASMQCSDGGWGWFSGWGERSWPHTTAVVVHGLQIARENDVALIPGVLERGIAWLKRYQAEQVRQLKNWPKKIKPRKRFADNLDAFVYMVLVDQKKDNKEMRDFLYRDRNHLAVYAKAMFAMALHNVKDIKKRDMLIRNVEQFLVQDDENQTAYLKLPANNWWWYWYGSEYEAQAYYLKLLALTNPKSETASRLVKYLINNRKHATYWKSTRDTAVCIEAFADYIKASGEDKPDMTLTILIDGKAVKEVKINGENLFTFDNKVVLVGKEVTTGKHKIELVRKGTGPVYFNAYLTNFTLEDPITRAGLEIKVRRKYYKLVRVDKEINVRGGARGQAVGQKVEKYKRLPLKNLALLKSGDLVEIELEIESKNDYEYIMFEDMKAAGFEPVDVRSGYRRSGMGAYIELRDERVTFFVRRLARGKHSISYRMRAEIPGRFSALPTKASAMYAPELKANSDEIKLRIED